MRWFAVAIVLAAAPGAVQGARAQSAKPYVDVTFLIDNSESMMIASTSAGVTACSRPPPPRAVFRRQPSTMANRPIRAV